MSLRERINGDPKLQIGLGAVLLLLVVFVLMHKGGGEESEAVTEEPTAATVETGETVEGTEAGVVGAEGEASLASLSENVKAPPLPKKVTKAYDADKTVAVLFVHDGSIDDKLVKAYSQLLHKYLPQSHNFHVEFKLFVVPVKQIGHYAALTFSMGVQRVPALVVLRRKSLSKKGPEASILYGYQAPSRIGLALRNASYRGPSGSYHPG